jgi:hypothetical protein
MCTLVDKDMVFDALEKWDIEKMEYKYLDRETGLKDVSFEMTSPKKEVII